MESDQEADCEWIYSSERAEKLHAFSTNINVEFDGIEDRCKLSSSHWS